MTRPLRIAHVAPPFERVPPRAYGGTERIVYELVVELDRRGYDITTFASGDSEVPGPPRGDRPRGAAPVGLQRRFAPVHARDDAQRARPGARVRPHPRPPRMGQPDARAGRPGAGRDHDARAARPALGDRGADRPAGRSGRDQQEPGVDAPDRAVDGDPQRADPRRFAVRAATDRRPLLRRAGRAGEGDRRGDRHRAGDRAGRCRIAAKAGPTTDRARLLRERRSVRRSRPPVRMSSSSASSSRPIATGCSRRATRR